MAILLRAFVRKIGIIAATYLAPECALRLILPPPWDAWRCPPSAKLDAPCFIRAYPARPLFFR